MASSIGKQAAVGPQRLDLDPPADHPALPGSEEARQARAMGVPQMRRDDDVAQQASDHRLAAMAEHALGGRVELPQDSRPRPSG